MARLKQETAETEDSSTAREKLPDAPKRKPGEYDSSGVVGENTREEQNYRKGQKKVVDAIKGDGKSTLQQRKEAVVEGGDEMSSARDRYHGRFDDIVKDMRMTDEHIARGKRDRDENRRIGGYSKGGKVSTGAKREYPKGKC